jgi:hypothetical protein
VKGSFTKEECEDLHRAVMGGLYDYANMLDGAKAAHARTPRPDIKDAAEKLERQIDAWHKLLYKLANVISPSKRRAKP